MAEQKGADGVADVFISYHEKSAGELVAKIADALERAGISCWYAKRDIPPGGDFAQHIPPQIDACKVFLLILNESVYQSKHIENEVGLAFGRMNREENITIIPLELEGFTRKEWVKYYLVHVQSVKFQSVAELIKKMSDILLTPPKKFRILSGKCGENVTYTLNEEGTLTISGTGAMKSYAHDTKTDTLNTPWRNEYARISHVNIEHGVSSIGRYAFFKCSNLTSVSISDTVTKIEAEAFGCCRKLLNITIPDSVTRIDVGAFEDCRSLTSIIIPDSVTKIDWWVFKGCNNLTSISVPRNVKAGFHTFPETADITYRAKRK